MRYHPDDRSDPLRPAEIEPHRRAVRLDREMTKPARARQALVDRARIRAGLIRPTSGHTSARLAEALLRCSKLRRVLERGLDRRVHRIHRSSLELHDDVRLEARAI